MHAAVHEFGHVLFGLKTIDLWEADRDTGILRAILKPWQAGAEVSDYAGTSPLEFVAEVFAGIMLGKHYSGSVMDFYRALGGQIHG